MLQKIERSSGSSPLRVLRVQEVRVQGFRLRVCTPYFVIFFEGNHFLVYCNLFITITIGHMRHLSLSLVYQFSSSEFEVLSNLHPDECHYVIVHPLLLLVDSAILLE